jgi:hypothetical protein
MPDICAGGRKRWSDKHAFTVRTGLTRALQALNDMCQTSVFTDMKGRPALRMPRT